MNDYVTAMCSMNSIEYCYLDKKEQGDMYDAGLKYVSEKMGERYQQKPAWNHEVEHAAHTFWNEFKQQQIMLGKTFEAELYINALDINDVRLMWSTQ